MLTKYRQLNEKKTFDFNNKYIKNVVSGGGEGELVFQKKIKKLSQTS